MVSNSNLYEVGLNELSLSLRVFNTLGRAKINNVGTILDQSITDLLGLQGFGYSSFNNLIERLRVNGFLLAQDEALLDRLKTSYLDMRRTLPIRQLILQYHAPTPANDALANENNPASVYIADIGLKNYPLRILLKNNIETVSNLLDLTIDELWSMVGFGQSSYWDLLLKLEQHRLITTNEKDILDTIYEKRDHPDRKIPINVVIAQIRATPNTLSQVPTIGGQDPNITLVKELGLPPRLFDMLDSIGIMTVAAILERTPIQLLDQVHNLTGAALSVIVERLNRAQWLSDTWAQQLVTTLNSYPLPINEPILHLPLGSRLLEKTAVEFTATDETVKFRQSIMQTSLLSKEDYDREQREFENYQEMFVVQVESIIPKLSEHVAQQLISARDGIIALLEARLNHWQEFQQMLTGEYAGDYFTILDKMVVHLLVLCGLTTIQRLELFLGHPLSNPLVSTNYTPEDLAECLLRTEASELFALLGIETSFHFTFTPPK